VCGCVYPSLAARSHNVTLRCDGVFSDTVLELAVKEEKQLMKGKFVPKIGVGKATLGQVRPQRNVGRGAMVTDAVYVASNHRRFGTGPGTSVWVEAGAGGPANGEARGAAQ